MVIGLDDIMEKFRESFKIPEYNGKPCRDGCNCVDIAEAENGGEGVKQVKCHGMTAEDRAKFMEDFKKQESEGPIIISSADAKIMPIAGSCPSGMCNGTLTHCNCWD